MSWWLRHVVSTRAWSSSMPVGFLHGSCLRGEVISTLCIRGLGFLGSEVSCQTPNSPCLMNLLMWSRCLEAQRWDAASEEIILARPQSQGCRSHSVVSELDLILASLFCNSALPRVHAHNTTRWHPNGRVLLPKTRNPRTSVLM